MDKSKQDTIRELTRGSPCCVCRRHSFPRSEIWSARWRSYPHWKVYATTAWKKGIEMELNDKLLLLDFEKYLEKKRRKIGNASHGFDRGQHEFIPTNMEEVKKTKEALWGKMNLCLAKRWNLMDFNLGYYPWNGSSGAGYSLFAYVFRSGVAFLF